MRRLSLVLFGVVLLLAAAVHPASTEAWLDGGQNMPPTDKSSKNNFVPGEILVRFRQDSTPAKNPGSLTTVRTAASKEIPLHIQRLTAEDVVPGLRLARVRPDDTLEAIQALRARADVLYAEPNYILYEDAVPNDSRYSEMYALNNTGQAGGVAGADIDAELAWNVTTGSENVVVAVIDSGIDIAHQDLQENIWTNPGEIADNGLDDDQNGFVDDVRGWDFFNNDKTVFDSATIDDHGTHVAGTIGAVGNNSLGVVGVNWRVKLLPLKFIGTENGGGPTSAAIAAINYAKQLRARGVNLRVVNASWGGRSRSQALFDAISSLNSAGMLFVAAAGNDNTDNFKRPHYPANLDLPNIISVAATTSSDGRASFTNFSDRLVKMGAPGAQILSTLPNNEYGLASGTSMAAPHVSGGAALLLAAAPNTTLTSLGGALVYSGDRNPSLENATISSRRLNVSKSLQTILENDHVTPAPAGNLQLESQQGITIGVRWNAPGDDGMQGTAADYDLFFVDTASGTRFLLPTITSPAAPGTPQTILNLRVPYRSLSATIELRTYDNAGNFSVTSRSISFAPHSADPYEVSLSAPSALSTGGVRLPLNGDDAYLNVSLPISFDTNIFGGVGGFDVSTNGALFFTSPPRDGDGFPLDFQSSADFLMSQGMIAGLWDDLVIDNTARPDDGVYEVRPNPQTVIYRWQGVTFDDPTISVSFEIELKSNNSIVLRYGNGNASVFPIVGIALGQPRAYLIESHSAERGSGAPRKSLSNADTITFTRRSPPPVSTYDLGTTSYFAIENGNSLSVTVTRGATTPNGFPILGSHSVDYSTSNGTAIAGLDYVATSGTLTFQMGETTKTFNVPLLDDSISDPNEVFNVTLSNPSSNTQLGSRFTATVTIIDNDAGGPNAIDDARTFVRQHYLDFLNREPDQGGWDYWTAQITDCGSNALCVHSRRIGVSGAFFVELEFQRTGYVVYRMHRAAFGTEANAPTLAKLSFEQFMADRPSVIDGPGLPQSTIDFANAFVQRQTFVMEYPIGLSNAQFVNKLFDTASLTPYVTERQQQIDAMTNNGKTRAQVLLEVIEIAEFKTREYNRSFVLMQYFGYLRRGVDLGGYNFWLNVLDNREPNNYRGMICSFLTSAEYQQRFGTTVTRTNADCAQ